MKDPATSTSADLQSGPGFHISNEPIVRSKGLPASIDAAVFRELPASYDMDVLYVIARDPKSLFVYWDLNWRRLFLRAGLSARQVHLRIYRSDGSIEGTHEINPFRGHYYADVGSAGTGYYCEIGCFEGRDWTSLVRSKAAATPEDGLSDDISAQFATLPIHLSFQRMLEMIRATQPEDATLARSVGELQDRARALRDTVTPEEWSRIVAAAASRNGPNGGPSSDISALLEAARTVRPTAEQLAKWKELGEHFGGASWGGASGRGFSGSSSA